MKNELLTKGIILPSGEIGKNKINLMENLILPKQDKRKTPQTATFQTAFSMKKRGNFIPPLFRCWLPQSLLR